MQHTAYTPLARVEVQLLAVQLVEPRDDELELFARASAHVSSSYLQKSLRLGWPEVKKPLGPPSVVYESGRPRIMKLIFPNRFPSRIRHVLLVHRVSSQMSSETEEELKQEIEEFRVKVTFLRICSPHGPHTHSHSASSFTGVVLVMSEDDRGTGAPSVQAHKEVLISKSPVLKPCWRMRWKKVEVEPLRSVMCPMIFFLPFVHYLYTTEVFLDEQMAYELLVLGREIPGEASEALL